MRLEIRLLGPLEAEAGGKAVKIIGERRIGVLVRLALDAGQPVPAELLLSDVWASSSAATATKQLHIVVSKLREAFAAHGDEQVIETVPGGYRLAIEPDHVDVHAFARLSRLARAARAEGDTATADTLFRGALGLWRGPALAEVNAPWAQIEAGRLEGERLAVLEDHAELRLAAGEHHALAGDLAAHVREHPLRERPAGQLMLALYRDGRVPEALEVYQRLRRVMVAEVGVEPGADVRRLHQAILVKDPALDLPRARQVRRAAPAELPSAVQAFTARTAEVERLRTDLAGDAAVTVIDGPGGIGKSALAVHVAHVIAERFTDGVIYVNLHGSTAGLAPLAPIEALRHLLRSLGLDGAAIPSGTEEAAARYRSLTAASDLLIILDNARDVRQVRPLLPAGRGCRVLITSRDPLATLNNARHLHLGRLDDTHAATLLARLVGPGRVDAEPRAVEEIVRLCGGFPLALRIAGARLAARPDRPLSDLAVRLADATRRLDLLEYADLAVRAGIAVSHQHLREDPAGRDAARLLCLLGLQDLPTYTPATVAALAGWAEHRAETALEHLLDARLLEPAGPNRYQLHDLVRLYAREQNLPDEERMRAIGRVLHHYLATAQRAADLVNNRTTEASSHTADQPGEELSSLEAANGWLDRERDNLLAAVRQAARQADRAAAGLADALLWLFDRRGWFAEAIEVSEEVLRQTEEEGRWEERAYLLQGLATAHQQLGRRQKAVVCLKDGLACWDRAGLPDRKAGILNDLGITYTQMMRYDDALNALESALALTRRTGRTDHESYVRSNLAHVYRHQGRYTEAVNEARRALAMMGEQDPGGRGTVHDTLADSLRAAGLLREAVEEYEKGIALQREAGFFMGIAVSHWWLGHTLNDLGRHEEGRDSWRASLRLLREARLLTPAEEARYLAQPVPDTPEAIRNQL
ncbi:BTAD domain-containing putative transcriptional regulator [[Actinomadura] parvosata]|uniref:BTAD domain-containing putative transcriptional regulator n=1 Tax=[Actinomadura] parvosata TaxID=1955412 RepID=UPI00406C8B66